LLDSTEKSVDLAIDEKGYVRGRQLDPPKYRRMEWTTRPLILGPEPVSNSGEDQHVL